MGHAGCNCPGDGPAECGDGVCNGDETYETCPQDCLAPGTCPDDQVVDCDGTGECWPYLGLEMDSQIVKTNNMVLI